MATGVKIRLQELFDQKARQEGRARYTHEEIAEITGVSRPTVANWLKNHVDRVDMRVLVSFCNTLKCDIADLMVLVD